MQENGATRRCPGQRLRTARHATRAVVRLAVVAALLILPSSAAADDPAGSVDARRASGVAHSVIARIDTLHDTGVLHEADAAALDAIEVARRDGDATAVLALTLRRALVLADLGRLADAYLAVLQAAEDSSADNQDVRMTLAALHLRRQAGRSALDVLPPRESPESAEDVRRAATHLGLPPVAVLRGLATIAAGDAAGGDALLRAWLTATSGTPAGAGATIDAYVGLARAALARGRLDAARAHADDAAALARRTGHRLRLAEAELLLGRWARLTGDTTAADGAMRTALTIASTAGVPRLVAPAAHALYEGAAARGLDGEALELLRLHTDARLALASDTEAQRLVDVLTDPAWSALVPGAGGRAAPAAGTRPTGSATSDAMRNALLGASLSSLVLAAVLWRVGYTRGRRLLHYRQELDALKGTITKVGALDGLITICASCKDVSGDDGQWTRVEAYLAARTDARFTHSICPTCERRVLEGAGLTDEDQDGSGPDPASGAPKITRLQGGFDWPPSDEELARALDSAERATSGRVSSGRWVDQ